MLIFGSMIIASKYIAATYFPVEDYEAIRRLFLLGFSTVFWLGCAVTRTSPGALLLMLRLCRPDRTKVSFSDALIRSGFYFLYPVLTSGAKFEALTPWTTFVALFASVYIIAVLANGVVLGFTGATLMDRLTNSTFVSLSLPKHHIPKVMGVRIK